MQTQSTRIESTPTRRDFLKGAAGAAWGLAYFVPSSVLGAKPSSERVTNSDTGPRMLDRARRYDRDLT